MVLFGVVAVRVAKQLIPLILIYSWQVASTAGESTDTVNAKAGFQMMKMKKKIGINGNNLLQLVFIGLEMRLSMRNQ